MVIWISGIILFVVLIIWGIPWWIRTYNEFKYLLTRAEREFASIDAVIQRRWDNLHALSQIMKSYDSHEHTTLKEVVEARKPQQSNGYVNALLEQYPDLKANEMYSTLMDMDSKLESQLTQVRLAYNYSSQRYNELMRTFPYNIVASTHNFEELEYLKFKTETYLPKAIFEN